MKRIPLADRLVGLHERVFRIFLIVVQTAGANAGRGFGTGIPNLHLGTTTQINSAVATGIDFPIDVHLEVAVILGGAKVVAFQLFAVENENAVFDRPMRPHIVVGFFLCLGQLIG